MKSEDHPIVVGDNKYHIDTTVNNKPAIYEITEYRGLRHMDSSYGLPANLVLNLLEPGTIIIIGRKS